VDDDAADVIRAETARMPLELRELEPVGRVPGLEELTFQPGRDDLVDLPGRELVSRCEVERLEVLHVDGAVRPEPLAVGHAHGCPLGAETP
jgi:hypothetical protein